VPPLHEETAEKVVTNRFIEPGEMTSVHFYRSRS
jgi:hypothetical protein